MILSGISVHPHRLGVGENPKTLVRLQEKIMGLERRTPAATAMLITPRPFNEQSAMSPCQFGSGLKRVEHGWVPQEKKMGLIRARFTWPIDIMLTLKRRRASKVSVVCQVRIQMWHHVQSHYFLL